MRTVLIPCSLSLLALAGCHGHVDLSDTNGNSSGDVHIAMKDNGTGGSAVSVNIPGVNANVSLPSIDMGSHVDLDGITLAPDTKVSGINVDANDDGKGGHDDGVVHLSFTNPHAPATLLDHYAGSANSAGYHDVTRTGGSVSARKDKKTFTVNVTAQGAGSQGTITVEGRD